MSVQWTTLDGLGVLIITPTRELAYQIFEVLKKVGKYHDFSAALIIGEKRFNISKLFFTLLFLLTKKKGLLYLSRYA